MLHVLLPHEWLGHLYLKRRGLFNQYFLGDAGDFTKYWEHEMNAEWAQQHPCLQDMIPNGVNAMHAIGINFHGDEARACAI